MIMLHLTNPTVLLKASLEKSVGGEGAETYQIKACDSGVNPYPKNTETIGDAAGKL